MSEMEDVKRTESGVFYDLESNGDELYDKIHNGKRLTIGYDSTAESPREWDNSWNLSCSHERYDLGDENCRLNAGDYDSWEEYGEALREEYDIVELVPLYMTDHSSLALSIVAPNDRWDSGQIGFAFLTAENQKDLVGAYGLTDLHEASLKVLKQELEVYQEYLNGESYSIMVDDVNTGEMIDSIGGFYGTDFSANGLDDNIPEEFVEDVHKSLPMYFTSLEKEQSKSIEDTQKVGKGKEGDTEKKMEVSKESPRQIKIQEPKNKGGMKL